jgi:diaminohydroxyphosphoribosylaminopyrimidine deaminase/5-amino-6-(5-phosphoribosylamino)uracil reductase
VFTSASAATERCEALRQHGADVIVLPISTDTGKLDPRALIAVLGERGIQSLLLEGGPKVHGSFMDAGLVDEVVAFVAPILIGGKEAPAAFSGIGANTLDDATRLNQVLATPVGEDLMVQGFVQRQHQSILAPRFNVQPKSKSTSTEAA